MILSSTAQIVKAYSHGRSNKRYMGLLPVEDSGFLEDVAEVDVGVEEVGVQRHGFLEVVDGKPYFLAVGG